MRLRRLIPALLACFGALAPGVSAQESVVVYVVRHAERAEDGTNDPSISAEGQARAHLLAQLLADAGITRIHSTDFKRTRQTAAPTAEAAGMSPGIYDPRDLPAFAAQLKGQPGRHLVVGHSNTTPALVDALGGDAHGAIAEMEYDRLYILVVPAQGPVTTVLLRFGAPFQP